jgi:hypothetical protein
MSRKIMIDLLLPFKFQNKLIEGTSLEIPESIELIEGLLNHNFEEFLKNSIQTEPTSDVPDTIWTLGPKGKRQKRNKRNE